LSDTVEVAERVEPAPAGRPSRGLPRRIGEAFLRRREASVLVVAVALGVYFASASEAFLTKPNMVNISQATAPAAIIAAGMVLLLDEPLAAMGAKEGALILDLVRDLKARGDVSVVIIAHNYGQILEVCDRINLLQHGAITFDKATSETSVQKLRAGPQANARPTPRR
jgi:ABC-type sugar transport system ATPase subunit